MSSKSVQKAVEDYFRTMNPLSKKLAEDIDLTFQDESLLTSGDQADLLWGKFIDLKLEERYRSKCDPVESVQCFPVFYFESGEKLVIDEDTSNGRPFGSSWKDEHSSPFSWETKSQLNLHLQLDESVPIGSGELRLPKTPPGVSLKKFPTPKPTPKPSPRSSPALNPKFVKSLKEVQPIPTTTKPKQKLTPEPQCKTIPDIKANGQTKPAPSPVKLDVQPVKKIETQVKEEVQEVVVNKNVPEPCPEIVEDVVSESEYDLDSPAKSIPKTGFDFLDNW